MNDRVESLEAFARRSRRNAVVGAIGAAAVLCALLTLAIQEASTVKANFVLKAALDDQIEAKSKELIEKKTEVSQLQETANALVKRNELLRSEIAGAQAMVQFQSKTGPTPVATVVTDEDSLKIVSSIKATGIRGYKGFPVYDFGLHVTAASPLEKLVDHVDYTFNDPSFRHPKLTSSDPATGFSVSYRGWGCLDDVIVGIFLKAGNHIDQTFDMCASLGDAWK